MQQSKLHWQIFVLRCDSLDFFATMSLLKLRNVMFNFFEDHLKIFIENSKTDQYRDGAVIVIAHIGTD